MQDTGKENLAKKDRIDVLIERKKKNVDALTEKKKIDYTLVNKLQGQISQMNNKLADLNHRYNALEQNYKQSEDKCQKLSDNNKFLSDEFEKKDKDLKNMGAKVNYVTKEKSSLEDKLKENKGYINKLEQRILHHDKAPLQKRQTIDVSSPKKLNTESEEHGIDWVHNEMKQIIENQKYEIRLLTQTLQEKENRDSKLRDTQDFSQHLRQTQDDDAYENRKSLLNQTEGLKAFERLSYDYQNLLTSFRESQELLAQFKSREKGKEQEESIREDKYRSTKDNSEIFKKKRDTADVEKESLHKYIEELNQTIRSLTEENIRLQKGHEGIHLKHLTDHTKLLNEIDLKNSQIKDLEFDLSQERRKLEEMNKTLESYLEDGKALMEEKNKSRRISEINDLLNQEIAKLQQLITDSQHEVEFYKQETETLRKDKDNMRAELEEYVKRHSTIEQSLHYEKTPDFQNLKTSKILDELEQLEIEKKTLKDALKQAMQGIEAVKSKESEYEEALKQKQKQIENLVNSRNMMQNTLGDQVLNKERENKRLKEEFAKLKEESKSLNEENAFIRDLLRKQEKYIHEFSSANKSKHL